MMPVRARHAVGMGALSTWKETAVSYWTHRSLDTCANLPTSRRGAAEAWPSPGQLHCPPGEIARTAGPAGGLHSAKEIVRSAGGGGRLQAVASPSLDRAVMAPAGVTRRVLERSEPGTSKTTA